MPPASGIKAGKAFVEIHADNSKFVRGLKRAQAKLRAFGDRVTAIGRRVALLGAGATAGLVQAGRMFAKTGDQLDKLSKRTGVSVESLSELGFAAEQTGGDLGSLGGALQRMNRRLGRITAGQGSGTEVAALEALGLSAERLDQLDPEQRFLAIADAMAAMEDPAEAAGLAQRAFGTQVDAILPLLLEGAEGIAKYRQEAHDLGIVLSTADADAAAKFSDAMNRVSRTIKILAVRIGGALAPVLTKVSDQIAGIAASVGKWLKANRGLVTLVLAGTTAVAAFGGALIALGVAAKVAAVGIGVLVAVVKALKIAMVLLTSPIGVVVAAVAGAIAIFAAFTDAGREAAAKLGSWFRGLGETFGTMLGGMSDALQAGDLKLAAKILWLGLKAAWFEGIKPLRTAWATFVGGLRTVFAEGMAAVKRTFTNAASFIHRKLNEIEAARKSIVEVVAGEIAKAEVRARGAFDDSIDVEASVKAIDDQVGKAIAQINEDKGAALAKINADKAEAITEIAGDLAEKLGKITNETSGEIAGITEEIKAAKAELAALREDAKPAVGAADDSDDGGAGGAGRASDPARFGAQRASGVLRSRGTFNARAIQSLQDNPTLLRQIKALEDIQRNTRRTADAAEEGGATA